MSDVSGDRYSPKIGAMILAAGRGERMRPLSDATPKPLLPVAGKPLIAWQIEALVRAGFIDIVINAAHLATQLVEAIGDGHAFGARIVWSIEREPLETAGGIATALPLLPPGQALIVSGDICTDFDYAALRKSAILMNADPAQARVHLVMVANPPYHPSGDFALDAGQIRRDGPARLTFANIGLYDTALFRGIPAGKKHPLLPLYHDWIDRGLVSGERFDGRWANVGTPADLRALDREMRGLQR
jgi:MurNAc alpha-1-phosphate uridylyltransferase